MRPATANTTSRIEFFLDGSAPFAIVACSEGASRALLLFAEAKMIDMTSSEQVLAGTERAVARKAPRALPYFRDALRSAGTRIVPAPSSREVDAHRGPIGHHVDVAIGVAAINASVDYLVPLNRRHFIDDPGVAERSGLRVGTPSRALAWIKQELGGPDLRDQPLQRTSRRSSAITR